MEAPSLPLERGLGVRTVTLPANDYNSRVPSVNW